MDNLRNRFINKIAEIGKKSDLNELEGLVKRYVELRSKFKDKAINSESVSDNDVELDELSSLSDTLNEQIGQEILPVVSSVVENTVKHIIDHIVTQITPKDSKDALVDYAADLVVGAVEGGASLQDAIDGLRDNTWLDNEIRERIRKLI